MKKIKYQDGVIALSAIIFGYLFYYQSIGVNYFIFTLLQLLLIARVSSKENRTLKWCGVAIGVLISAISALLYGSLLSALGCVIGLILLSFITLHANTSVVIAFFHSIYSLLLGLLFLMKEKIEMYEENSANKSSINIKKNLLIILTTTLLGGVFFALYRQSNAQFKDWTNAIDLSFISIGWVFFTLLGYYLIHLLYKPYFVTEIRDFDLTTSNELMPIENEENETVFLNSKIKMQWGITIFATLNILLLAVNVTDIFYFLGNRNLNTIDYSAQVHQGIDALIFSIILAIAVILYFFGGSLNFIKENKHLRILAQIWVLQNVVLIGFTTIRNIEYVEAFFLTYKRIGVFVYLICCVVGLFFTYKKIRNIKTNWFLVRKVSWTLYFILMVTPIFNWDSFIINYNFNQAESNPKALDVTYLFSLPLVNSGLIMKRINESQHVNYYKSKYDNDLKYRSELIVENESLDWRSFNIRGYYSR